MATQAEVTAATWRPQLSAASYPQSGSTITSSYPGSSQVWTLFGCLTIALTPQTHVASWDVSPSVCVHAPSMHSSELAVVAPADVGPPIIACFSRWAVQHAVVVRLAERSTRSLIALTAVGDGRRSDPAHGVRPAAHRQRRRVPDAPPADWPRAGGARQAEAAARHRRGCGQGRRSVAAGTVGERQQHGHRRRERRLFQRG